MKKIKKIFSNKIFKAQMFIYSLMFPQLLLAGDTATTATNTASDFSKVATPLKLIGKLIALVMAIFYLLIGSMWIWLPILVILWTKKHYEKKFEERGEENSKDMLMKMAISGLGSAVVSFVIIGLFGMLFFGSNDLLNGINAYLGTMVMKIKTFALNGIISTQ